MEAIAVTHQPNSPHNLTLIRFPNSQCPRSANQAVKIQTFSLETQIARSKSSCRIKQGTKAKHKGTINHNDLLLATEKQKGGNNKGHLATRNPDARLPGAGGIWSFSSLFGGLVQGKQPPIALPPNSSLICSPAEPCPRPLSKMKQSRKRKVCERVLQRERGLEEELASLFIGEGSFF